MRSVQAQGYITQYGFTSNTATTVRCPDVLSIKDLGVADGWRGHLVRAFFRALRLLTGV